MIIDNFNRKTVVKNGKRIKFEDIKTNDIIKINNKKYRVICDPFLSIDLPEGTLEIELCHIF